MSGEGYPVVAALIRREVSSIEYVLGRIRSARELYESKRKGTEAAAIDSVALGVHGLYSGLERLFEAIAVHVDQSTPAGGSWHRDLLYQMTLNLPSIRPAVLNGADAQDLESLMRFRHLMRNLYHFDLDAVRVLEVFAKAEQVYPSVRAQLLAFADFLEGAADDLE